MDVKYTSNGQRGRTCGDCVNFKPRNNDTKKGDCFGHEVSIGGSCSFFKKKVLV